MTMPKTSHRFGYRLLAGLSAVAIGATAFGQSAPSASAPPSTPVVSPERLDYQLGSADKLRITVFGEDGMTGEYAVTSNGMISFPLIGEVDAVGHTLGQVRDEIRSRLAAGYLRDPRVAIEVVDFRTFYILGEVNKPGEYPYRANLTLDQAVATAGGFTYRAARHRIMLRHPGERLDSKLALEKDHVIPVAPGDTVRVLERFF
jgi:polysaccharide export outer membrane protein